MRAPQGSYLPVAPLLILIGALDDWTPPAPCVELGKWTPKVQRRGVPRQLSRLRPSAARVRVRTDVPNGVKRGEGVTVGSNREARERAYAAVFEFLERELR